MKWTLSTFSRIFGGEKKDLQKQADELLLQLSKALQSASAKLRVAAELWEERDYEKLQELKKEIINLERSSDQVKQKLEESIFSKGAYMPQQTQERYALVNHMDSIIDAAEEAVRLMDLSRLSKPPEEITDIANKCWICTDLLQDAIKCLFTDFEKSVEYCIKVDLVREEARDIKFELLYKLFNKYEYKAKEIIQLRLVSERVLQVAVKAEITADYIRALAIRYS